MRSSRSDRCGRYQHVRAAWAGEVALVQYDGDEQARQHERSGNEKHDTTKGDVNSVQAQPSRVATHNDPMKLIPNNHPWDAPS